MSVNTVALSGNLTRDMELRTTASGMPIGSFSIAFQERRKEGDTWVDYPNFIDCTIFGRFAEAIVDRMTKGTKVALCGSLHQSRWERDGQKRSKIEVRVDTLDICTKKTEPAPSDDLYYDENVPF